MRKKLAVFMASLMLALSLTACGGSSSETSSQAAPAETSSGAASSEAAAEAETTGAPKRGGVLVTSRVGVTPLNPIKYIAMQGDKIIEGLFFDSLVNINEPMEVEPFLAESWTISDDGLTLDMKLKEGVH